jgi:hypothetical protein
VGSALSDDDSSSSSDDSDFDRLYDGGYSRSDTPRRYSSDTDTSASGALGAMSLRPNAPKPFTEIVPDGRRGSVVESEATARAAGRRSGGKGSAFVEEQYNYSLGYNLDFLGDLLCPPRAACNRKFEVSVDELVFIGHPVCTSPDGKWAYPSNDSDEDEDDARGAARGRRMNDKEKERQPSIGAAGAARAQELRPVREESPHTRFERLQDNTPSLTPLHVTPTPSVSSGAESGVPLGAGSGSGSGSVSGTTRNGKKEEDAGMLTMFHLVLIVDKPDPRPEGEADLAEVFSHLYREIAFKWTAAAFALQVRDDWVGKEVRKLTQIREKAITEGGCWRLSISSTN